MSNFLPRMSGLLRLAYPSNTAKMVARETGLSERTIEDWLRNRHTASADAILKLTFQNRLLKAEILRALQGSQYDEIATAADRTGGTPSRTDRAQGRLALEQAGGRNTNASSGADEADETASSAGSAASDELNDEIAWLRLELLAVRIERDEFKAEATRLHLQLAEAYGQGNWIKPL